MNDDTEIPSETDFPTLADFEENLTRIRDRIVETPAFYWDTSEISEAVVPGTRVTLKLELFQHTGTFKLRGALTNLLALDDEARGRGVTAVSAGNHAIATAYAAKAVGTTAKVVMLATASKVRVEKCRALGAEIIMIDDIHGAFDEVARIERDEGRTFIHPFDGPGVALGTGTLGLEFIRQVPNLDAVIIPIGGGGLCSGVAAAMKLVKPEIEVYGVEPTGADTMTRSFASGQPEKIDKVRTIADSLGAPHAAPYSMALCRRYVDEIVLVEDAQMIDGMRRLFGGMKLAVEPAGAAATAALVGPLRERLAGRHVGLIVCGSNISSEDFCRLISGQDR